MCETCGAQARMMPAIAVVNVSLELGNFYAGSVLARPYVSRKCFAATRTSLAAMMMWSIRGKVSAAMVRWRSEGPGKEQALDKKRFELKQ